MVGFGIYAAVNAGGETSVSQPNAPAAPVAPTPAAPTPVINESAPVGVIKITVEKLVSDLLIDPNKYKKGTVFQVSGMYWGEKVVSYGDHSVSFYLNPPVQASTDTNISVEIYIKMEGELELLKTFQAMNDSKVVVRGTYIFFKTNKGGDGKNYAVASLEKVSLISATPAK